jgi:RimJ/RimL family protein N-acetyltransferase
MRLNEATTLATDRIVLRPYRRWHVPRYHEWMASEEMQQATA